MTHNKKSLNYTWVIIVISFLMVFTVLGFCSSARSLYIAPICEALNVSRSAFSINDSCRFITTSIMNIFFGALVAKFGLKKLIIAGFASLIISSLLYSVANNIFIFYIGGVFLGLGIAWTTTTMVGAIVNRWCKKNRGTIMGFILASNGLGAALAIQILTPIIYNENNPFGFQNSYRLVSLILLAITVVIILFFRENPKTEETVTESNEKKKNKVKEYWEGIPFFEIRKKWYFYCVIVCIFLIGMILQGISGIAAPHLTDIGLSASFIATALSIHSISLGVFKFLTGFIYDKFGLRITTNICLLSAISVMIILANVTNSQTGKAFALIYAIFSALALPLETIMLPIFANDLFGEQSFNKILGIFSSVNVAGYALGAPIVNLCYDITGSYNIALYIASILVIIITIIMQFIISSSKKVKKTSNNA